MNAWLGRMPWAVGFFIGAATWIAALPSLAAPPSEDQLRAWVSQLDADDFVARETAERHLIASGEAAIGPLADAISGTSPEAAWRASAALEKIAVRGNEASAARVAATLQQLSRNQKPGLGTLANEIIAKQAHARQERAMARIRALGGKFDDDASLAEVVGEGLVLGGVVPRIVIQAEEEQKLGIEPPELDGPEAAKEAKPAAAGVEAALKVVDSLLSDGGADKSPPEAPAPPPDALPPETSPPDLSFVAPAIGEPFIGVALEAAIEAPLPADEETAHSLTIDRAWRGGDGGLAALRDLPSIISLSLDTAPLTDAGLLHIAALPKLQSLDIQSTQFTTAGLLKFREKRPDVRLFARGSAMLGVSANPTGPCILNNIFDGSGAAEAGLKAGDEITAVGDQKIRDFSDLTIAVFSQQPGNKLVITFNRDQQPQTADVILKERKTP